MYIPIGNLAIFCLFTGIALIEAFAKEQYLEGIFFFILGLLFLRADLRKKK